MPLHQNESEQIFIDPKSPASHPNRLEQERSKELDHDINVEHSRDLVCVHDLQGRLLSVNSVSARQLGYTVEDILKIPLRDLIDPTFRDQFDVYLREIERTGQAYGVMAILTRTGERRFWEYHNTLRTNVAETPMVRGFAHDVTDRLQAEKALRHANEKLMQHACEQEATVRELKLFRTLLDESNDAIEVVDPETMRLLDVNEKMSGELGYTREELLSMTIYDVDPNASKESVAQVTQELHKSGFVILESLHRRKDGTTFPVEVNIKRVLLDREYIVALSRNITQRKIRDGRLQEYERVVENLAEMVVVVNRDYRYVIANRAFLHRRQMTKEQVVGRELAEILHHDSYEATIKEKLDEAFGGKVVDYEMKYEYPDIGERALAITYLPVEGPTGIDRVAAVMRDVTERKQAAALLEESERRFRAVYESAPAGITLVDSQSGRFLQTNPKFCEIVGRSEEQLLQLGFRDITHPEDVAKSDDHFKLVGEGDTRLCDFEKRYVRPDGSVVWANLAVVPMGMLGKTCRSNMAIVQDITESKQAEEALRTSEREQRKIAEQLETERGRLIEAQAVAKVGSWETELPSLDITWSEQTHRIFETDPSHFHPRRPGFVELVHPEDRVRVDAAFEASLGKGAPSTVEYRIVMADGRVKVLEEGWKVFHDGQGRPARLMGTCQDITERKQMEEELRKAKQRLTEEKLYLEQEIDTEHGFQNIVGRSKPLKDLMETVGKVATSGATVLLLGETGTGKELVARAIHRLSQRSGSAFIKMNCAAIPTGLLESELFGNEKGAFTGAVSKKIGRLELADKGTLFLDEIGEISLDLQPKLLRVLQDHEFERLGGTQTLNSDFRLIAATNRDLAESVRENEFRSDLFYRLNVFPIHLPPLRERRDDIPLLVEHFVQKCGRRMNKSITSIPKKTMLALTAWDWPGNIRELEHFIERSVILTNGSVLAAPLGELRPAIADTIDDDTLKAKERAHILQALRDSRGQISGPRGAASRLGLKRTTLQSKLKHLGINPRVPPPG